ncbi:alginate O-acetyltransferase AlgX-related protein [Albidovulum sediminicola]|uniref:AlgX/AlgJ SGNH hydrolase-like domain-containing protein n=1 Tax=Albidovulum sediminicola TaxID=2984331 RepID=A0ABT2Z4P1_9RHOB|nr:hypothetical protein [Defluviimonas sp. WL0075]MCV2866057.1 hypothetical protein [Defluviimonas sp. WL0075]
MKARMPKSGTIARAALMCGAILGGLALSPAAAQQLEGPYPCQNLEFARPSPTDPLGTLTQGQSGYFFRTDPDLNWGFFISDEVNNLIRDLTSELKARGTELVLLPIPPRGLIAQNFVDFNQDRSPILSISEGGWMFDSYIQDLRKSGAVVPNLMDALRVDPGQAPLFYFKRDVHWRPEGARFTAAQVAEELRQNGALTGLMASGFQTSVIGENQFKGVIAQAAQQHCTQNLPPERYSEYVTKPMATGVGFGNTEGAVVLVGGSFSADERLNFAGFLSQSLGLPVANHASASLREFNSIEAYLSSPEFHARPPKVLIWELQAAFDLNYARNDLRQLITATAANCQNNSIARVENASGSAGGITQLDVPSAQNVTGRDHYVQVSTSNPAMNNFVVSVAYQDGDSEWIPVERSGRFDNSGIYYISLSQETTSPVVGITLEQLSETPASTRVELCRK